MPVDRELRGRAAQWRPSFGAWPVDGGVRFRVWSPNQESVSVLIEGEGSPHVEPLEQYPDGTSGILIPGIEAGARYRYRISGGDFPDPASRSQPEGVHGSSEVVDPSDYRWKGPHFPGITLDDLVLYELHVGTFSPEGTFDGVTERLPYLKALGVTAIELMPVADFPGERNWGYDGVCLFAPARCYGRPDDLRRLVDEAHALGLAVFLDVVYNHLGPDGCYLPAFSPFVFSETHTSPWGQGLNYDGPHCTLLRQFFIENAQHWVHEYRFDGLRLDATHAIIDDSDRPFLCDLGSRVRESVHDRHVLVIAEDHRNLARMIRPEGEGGWGIDGVWADDFHHIVRVALSGEREGYFGDFEGTTAELADAINIGWLYCGQKAEHLGEFRGTTPDGVPPNRMVVCIQNHDQVGNRALGDRLGHEAGPAACRAAAALLLCAPETPLIFQGQEWSAAAPFQYFTDHNETLGRLVTEGRRHEFRHFAAFVDHEAREAIPDPQAESSFLDSKLDWSEILREPHASILRLYRSLIRLRGSEPALRDAVPGSYRASVLSERTLLLRRDAPPEVGPSVLVFFHLGGPSEIGLSGLDALKGLDTARLQFILTTEDRPFAPDGVPPAIEVRRDAPVLRLDLPAAVLLRGWPDASAAAR